MKIIFFITLLFGAVPVGSSLLPSEIITSTTPAATEIIAKPVRIGFQSSRHETIDTLVIHSSYNKTGGDVYSVEKMLQIYARYNVSTHYLIDREGSIYQLVRESDISYHAGISKMPDGRTGVNRFSLGIELLNTESDHCTEAQYQALSRLISSLKGRYPISSIVGHGQIAPTRKSDPWNFDWQRVR